MRRQDRKNSESESLAILAQAEYGFLAMRTTENGGYGVPLNYVLWHNAIYFHCAGEGAKLEFLKANNTVSFCVVGKTEILPAEFGARYESAMVFGKAIEVEEAEKREALMRMVEKYSPGFVQEGRQYIDRYFDRVKVFKISIDYISGKSHQ